MNHRVLELLAVNAMTLATCGPDGEPHAAAVYFAAGEQLCLYFFSAPHTRHGQDLAVDPRAAVAISPETNSWQDIHGLQLRGRAHKVEAGPVWELGWELYRAKFPFVSALKPLVARNTLYIFTPAWVRLVDNRLGLGHKEEWTLP